MDSDDADDLPLDHLQDRLAENQDRSQDSEGSFDPVNVNHDMEDYPQHPDIDLPEPGAENQNGFEPGLPSHHDTQSASDDPDFIEDDDVVGAFDKPPEPPSEAHPPAFSRLKKKRAVKSEPLPQLPSDSDDDIPIASRLKKPQTPPPKPPTRSRKPKAQQRRKTPEATTTKVKKEVKRTPRVKKEEDTPLRKFEKLGQRRETPPDNDPARLFYQSMYKEKIALSKKSVVADSWMLRNGLLSDKEAEKVMARWDMKR